MESLFRPAFMKMSIFEIGAMIVVLLNVWLYGALSLWGPILGVVGCVMWIIMGVRAKLYGLVILNIILMSQNVWNYVKWSSVPPAEKVAHLEENVEKSAVAPDALSAPAE